MKLLTDFGVTNLGFVDSPKFKIKNDIQCNLTNFNVGYHCKIDGYLWQNNIIHDVKCRYKYCKDGWDW